MREVWAPIWDLRVNGERLPDTHRGLITKVSAAGTVDQADELKIEADAVDPTTRAWRFVEDNVLAAGNHVVLATGWHPDLVTLQRFQVVRHQTMFGDGTPRVMVAAYSAEHRLAEYTQARQFAAGRSDAEIARVIADEHGLHWTQDTIPDLPTNRRAVVSKKGDSDLKLLQSLAYRQGFGPPWVQYDADLERDVLYFRATDPGQQRLPRRTFTYDPQRSDVGKLAGDLMEFAPTLNLAGVPTAVRVTGWDPASQQVITVTMSITPGTDDNVIFRGSGERITGLESGAQLRVQALQDANDTNNTKALADIPVHTIDTTESARSYAERWLRLRSQAFMTARAKLRGTPGLWVGQIHDIDGVPDLYAGPWEVVGVQHTIDGSGYHTTAQLDRVLTEPAEPTES